MLEEGEEHLDFSSVPCDPFHCTEIEIGRWPPFGKEISDRSDKFDKAVFFCVASLAATDAFLYADHEWIGVKGPLFASSTILIQTFRRSTPALSFLCMVYVIPSIDKWT